VILSERWLPFRHFYGGDAQAPHICLCIISRLSDDLWGHPEGCTDESVAERICQLGRDTEIRKLDFARCGKEDVRSLYVAMNGAFPMKIIQPQKEFAAYDGDVCFRKHGWLEEVETRATGQVLHYDPELIVDDKGAIIAGDEF
jgi:hypothetical protein